MIQHGTELLTTDCGTTIRLVKELLATLIRQTCHDVDVKVESVLVEENRAARIVSPREIVLEEYRGQDRQMLLAG